MRLKDSEISAIKETITSLDQTAKIYLFGSRVYDDKKGGDIDILIFSGKLTNRDKRRIRINLYDRIGEQKIDIVLAKDLKNPFVRLAVKEGIPL
jgi:predicted nucleotidyltransferase